MYQTQRCDGQFEACHQPCTSTGQWHWKFPREYQTRTSNRILGGSRSCIPTAHEPRGRRFPPLSADQRIGIEPNLDFQPVNPRRDFPILPFPTHSTSVTTSLDSLLCLSVCLCHSLPSSPRPTVTSTIPPSATRYDSTRLDSTHHHPPGRPPRLRSTLHLHLHPHPLPDRHRRIPISTPVLRRPRLSPLT